MDERDALVGILFLLTEVERSRVVKLGACSLLQVCPGPAAGHTLGVA